MKTPAQHTPARLRHMQALRALTDGRDTGNAIWLRLRRVEMRLTRATVAACNTQSGVDALPAELKRARAHVQLILGFLPQGFFINTDPRGYALKLDNDKVPLAIEGLQRDSGGYYILAPEF